jgi:hypothetical protein
LLEPGGTGLRFQGLYRSSFEGILPTQVTFGDQLDPANEAVPVQSSFHPEGSTGTESPTNSPDEPKFRIHLQKPSLERMIIDVRRKVNNREFGDGETRKARLGMAEHLFGSSTV